MSKDILVINLQRDQQALYGYTRGDLQGNWIIRLWRHNTLREVGTVDHSKDRGWRSRNSDVRGRG